jgi:hypothetical protein
MKAINIDQTSRIARAEGGVLWRELDEQPKPMVSLPLEAPSPTPASRVLPLAAVWVG